MARSASRGTCNLCGAPFSKGAMTRHLKSCLEKRSVEAGVSQKKLPQAKLFHIQVQARHAPDYWMHVELPSSAKLTNLDDFLRTIWLECCGHLSEFEIDAERFVSGAARELDAKSMNFPLYRYLAPGQNFSYQYDFGTTTYLTLRVIGMREGEMPAHTVRVLARNDPPAIVCDVCGKPATDVCTQCLWEGKGFLCDECAPEHECGEEMLLPVVNSPRMGECGYTGPATWE